MKIANTMTLLAAIAVTITMTMTPVVAQRGDNDHGHLRRLSGRSGRKGRKSDGGKIQVLFPTSAPVEITESPAPSSSPSTEDEGREGDGGGVVTPPIDLTNPFAGTNSCVGTPGTLPGEIPCETFADCAGVNDSGASAGFSCCIWPACQCRPAVRPGVFPNNECTRDEVPTVSPGRDDEGGTGITPVAPMTPSPVTLAPVAPVTPMPTPAPVTPAPVAPVTPVTPAPTSAVTPAPTPASTPAPTPAPTPGPTPAPTPGPTAPLTPVRFNPFAGSNSCVGSAGSLPNEVPCETFADCAGVVNPDATSGITCCIWPACQCRPATIPGTFPNNECTAN